MQSENLSLEDETKKNNCYSFEVVREIFPSSSSYTCLPAIAIFMLNLLHLLPPKLLFFKDLLMTLSTFFHNVSYQQKILFNQFPTGREKDKGDE